MGHWSPTASRDSMATTLPINNPAGRLVSGGLACVIMTSETYRCGIDLSSSNVFDTSFLVPEKLAIFLDDDRQSISLSFLQTQDQSTCPNSCRQNPHSAMRTAPP